MSNVSVLKQNRTRNRIQIIMYWYRQELGFYVFYFTIDSHNVTLEETKEKTTILLLLNPDDRVVRSFNLWGKSREECNSILISAGFFRKNSRKDSIPVAFLAGPYKPR
jgi:hypothetical protein